MDVESCSRSRSRSWTWLERWDIADGKLSWIWIATEKRNIKYVNARLKCNKKKTDSTKREIFKNSYYFLFFYSISNQFSYLLFHFCYKILIILCFCYGGRCIDDMCVYLVEVNSSYMYDDKWHSHFLRLVTQFTWQLTVRSNLQQGAQLQCRVIAFREMWNELGGCLWCQSITHIIKIRSSYSSQCIVW